MYVFFAYRRARRPHAQVTHVFLPLLPHTELGSWSLRQRGGDPFKYDFCSAWGLGKEVLAMRPAMISVRVAQHENGPLGTVILDEKRWFPDSVRVWPEASRPQPQEKRGRAEAIDRLQADFRPRRRPPVGGIVAEAPRLAPPAAPRRHVSGVELGGMERDMDPGSGGDSGASEQEASEDEPPDRLAVEQLVPRARREDPHHEQHERGAARDEQPAAHKALAADNALQVVENWGLNRPKPVRETIRFFFWFRAS